MNRKKKLGYMKWPLYILFVLLLFCFQIAPNKLGLFSHILFLLPFVITFSCFEDTLPSVIMAACCGFLWDYGATGIFGVRALLLSVFALAISIIVKFYVMPVFLSVTVAHASATVIYLLLEFLLMYAVKDYGSLDIILIEHYLPALIKTVLAGILISYITMKIYKLKPHISGIEL